MAKGDAGGVGAADGKVRREPRYLQTLFLFFILPFLFLARRIHASVQRKPFYLTVAVVCVLGWAWSALLSARGWWEFPEKFIVGIRMLPYVPLEEFLIYPLGGIFSVFLYVYPAERWRRRTSRAGYWAFLLCGTGAALVLLWFSRACPPRYLQSQLLLYNGLCLCLAPFVAARVDPAALAVSVGGLSMLGAVWDWLAFRSGWWVYHAISGIKLAGVPVEDLNFYLFAPTAAVSLYILLCRAWGVDPHAPEKP